VPSAGAPTGDFIADSVALLVSCLSHLLTPVLQVIHRAISNTHYESLSIPIVLDFHLEVGAMSIRQT